MGVELYGEHNGTVRAARFFERAALDIPDDLLTQLIQLHLEKGLPVQEQLIDRLRMTFTIAKHLREGKRVFFVQENTVESARRYGYTFFDAGLYLAEVGTCQSFQE